MALTDAQVRQAKPRTKSYTLSDSGGLVLFVAPNDAKYWHFRFSWKGKRARISFGRYPQVSLRQARLLRDEARGQLAQGNDPRTDRPLHVRSSAGAGTLAELAERWYAFKSPRLSNAPKGTAWQLRRYLDKDILPRLGHLPLAETRRPDVLTVQRQIEERRALNIAKKVRGWLNEMFRFAVAEGLMEINPAADLDVVAEPEPPVRHHPFLRKEELPEFLRTLRDAKVRDYTRYAIELLLLTGVRTGELRQATIDQFDLDGRLWTIPVAAVKQLSVLQRKADHVIPPYLVPLSRQAADLVRKVHAMTGGYRLILPGCHDPKQPISDGTINMALKRMGYHRKLTGHGIRSTLSTALNEMRDAEGRRRYDPDWIEAQLSHAGENKIRKTYNHAEYVDARREMMQDWADWLDSLV